MFTHALPQGSLRPFEALPPTLTPNAILAMAPPAQRRLSFLGACVVYAGCGLAMTLAPSLNLAGTTGAKTDSKGFVVPADTKNVIVDLKPDLPPPPPTSFKGITNVNAPERDPGWVPPSVINEVPETPTTVPTENQFDASIRRGISNSPNTTQPSTSPNDGRGVEGGSMAPVEIDFRQMTVLSQTAPFYPPLARISKIQGDVVLLMTVDPHGIPTEVKALSGPHPSLEMEAMRAARLWRFVPASMNGQAVSAQFRLTIIFRLK